MEQQSVQPNQAGEALGKASRSSPSSRRGTSKSFASILLILSRIVFAVLVISCLAAFFPVQPWSPLWYLKIGQIAIDYAVTLLFAISLYLLSGYFGNWIHRSSTERKTLKRFIIAFLYIYVALIPIQIFGFGLNWYQTGQQNKQTILEAQAQLSTLRDSIRAATTDQQLQAFLGANVNNLPPAAGINLAQQKNALIDTFASRLSELSARLTNERRQRLVTLAVSTVKGVLGAGVMAFGLAGIKRLVVQK